MNKVLSTAFAAVIFLISSLHTQSQIKKGETMLGATLGFSTESTTYDGISSDMKSTEVQVIPQLGFGLGNNWIAGVSLGYAYAKAGYHEYTYYQKANVFTGGVFLRKFYNLHEKFGVYGQLNVAAGFGKGENTNGNPHFETDITILNAAVQPGFYFRAGRKLLLEANFGNLGFTNTKRDYTDGGPEDSKTNQFNFSLTEGLAIGFKIVL